MTRLLINCVLNYIFSRKSMKNASHKKKGFSLQKTQNRRINCLLFEIFPLFLQKKNKTIPVCSYLKGFPLQRLHGLSR